MKTIYRISFLLSVIILINSCSKDDSTTTSNVGELDSVSIYGGTKNDSGQSVVSTNDGGYVILGESQSMDGDITDKQNESYDYWLLKFNSNSELEWQKTYGGTGDDFGKSVIQTQDGGYAILGSSFSNDEDVTTNNGQQDYWMAKLDTTGNIVWEKSFGYSGSDTGISLLQSNDGGYLLTGILDVTSSGGEGNTKNNQTLHAGGDYWAIKLNATGDLQWSKYFGGFFSDTPFGAIQTEDNGFIIVGSSDSEDTDISGNIGDYDFWVIKISSIGNLEWEKSFGGTQIDEARGVVESNDGNYVIVGDTRSEDVNVSNSIGNADLWLIKITPTGNLIWEKTIGGLSFDVGRSISKTQDGGFLLSGSSRSSDFDVTTNKGQNDAWVLKVNNSGDIEWGKTVGGSNIEFANSVTELNNKTIIAVGETSSNDGDISGNLGFDDLLLIKIN